MPTPDVAEDMDVSVDIGQVDTERVEKGQEEGGESWPAMAVAGEEEEEGEEHGEDVAAVSTKAGETEQPEENTGGGATAIDGQSASAAAAAAAVEETPTAPAPARLLITKMEMENFKSYGGLREIGPFHKCFSSIVGPNGSGKSNVIDAMLFVFGKRAKKLRLNKLGELIHRSDTYPNLDFCRVSVHFVDILDVSGSEDDYEEASLDAPAELTAQSQHTQALSSRAAHALISLFCFTISNYRYTAVHYHTLQKCLGTWYTVTVYGCSR